MGSSTKGKCKVCHWKTLQTTGDWGQGHCKSQGEEPANWSMVHTWPAGGSLDTLDLVLSLQVVKTSKEAKELHMPIWRA